MKHFDSIQAKPPLIAASVALAAIFSALNYHGHDYSYRWNLLALFILVAATALHVALNAERDWQLRRHGALIAYAGYIGWGLLSLTWSTVPSESMLAWLTQLTALFALYLGYQADAKQWRALLLLMPVLIVSVSGYTLYQGLALKVDRPAGFMLNWNSNAAFIALLLIPYFAFFLQTDRAWRRHALGVLMAFGAMAIAVTESRGGLAVLLFGLIPVGWQYGRQQRRWARVVWLVAYLALGFVLAELLQGGALTQRLAQQAGNADVQSLGSGRHALWLAGWHMYLDKPWLGWGLGIYHWLYPHYRDPLLVEMGQMAHNDYLEILLSLGPVGLLAILGFVGCVARLLWRAWRRQDLLQLALAAAAMAILLHSSVDFNLFQPAILIVLGLFVGYLERLGRDAGAVEAVAPAFRPSLRVGLAGLMTAVFGVWFGTIVIGLQQIELASAEKSPSQRLARLDQARRWLPYFWKLEAFQAATVVDLLKTDNPEGLSAQEHAALIDFALGKIDRTLTKNPLWGLSYRNRGELLESRASTPQQIDAVVAAYRAALRLDPYDLDARFRLSEVLVKRGHAEEARQLMFDGFEKAYFTDLQKGLGFLVKIKALLEAEGMSDSQLAVLNQTMEPLVRRMMRYQNGLFVLRKAGLEPDNG